MGLVRNNILNVEKLTVGADKKEKQEPSNKIKEIREKLYVDLARIIKLFPSKTPTDILLCAEDIPCFHGDYQTTIYILNIKIDDAVDLLQCVKDTQRKYEIKTKISNWRYVIKELEGNQKAFEEANALYEKFREDYSGEIEVVFSQEVKNKMVEFDVFRNNAFGMPGHCIKEDTVRIIKDEVIFAMRKDLGTL